MKQTAIKWFFEQLTEVDYNCINKTFLQNNNSLAGYRLRELFEQAKEMEKEQHWATWGNGVANAENEKLFQDHWNETYEGGEQ
jgi:hypothetical protein